MPLTALIVDDEYHARENLRMLLEEFCPEVTVIGDAGNVKEALDKTRELNPEVVFLDIRMPSGSEGFDFLEQAGEVNFQVVFVTAFKDYAVQAFNANAIHYVLKPIDIEDLQSAVQKLVATRERLAGSEDGQSGYVESLKALSENLRSNKRPHRITLHHSRGFRLVDDTEIVRIEAENTQSRLFFTDGSQTLDSRHLKLYEDMLDPERFIRVHKSHIINLDALKEYIHVDGHTAILNDGAEVPIARARLSDFLSRVKGL